MRADPNPGESGTLRPRLGTRSIPDASSFLSSSNQFSSAIKSIDRLKAWVAAPRSLPRRRSACIGSLPRACVLPVLQILQVTLHMPNSFNQSSYGPSHRGPSLIVLGDAKGSSIAQQRQGAIPCVACMDSVWIRHDLEHSRPRLWHPSHALCFPFSLHLITDKSQQAKKN